MLLSCLYHLMLLDAITLFDCLFLWVKEIELTVAGGAGYFHRVRESIVGRLRLLVTGCQDRVVVVAVKVGVLTGEAGHSLFGGC